MFKKEISADIKTGTTIAILDNRISSKNGNERLFSARFYESEEAANKTWNSLKDYITKDYNIEIIDKEYPAINRTRKEMEIKGLKMKDTKWLNKANEINEEVKELERFIGRASNGYRIQLILYSVVFNRTLEYNMPTEVKNEVLDVLLRRKEYLLNELNEIRKL